MARGRRRRRGRACALSRGPHAIDPQDRALDVRPARPQSRTLAQDRRPQRGFRPRLWLAVRARPRGRPQIRDARRFREFREARLLDPVAASFRRHGLRTGRHSRQQAPSRHGRRAFAPVRQAVHGLGDRAGTGRRFDRDGADRLRTRVRRRALRHHGQHQRQFAPRLRRDDDQGVARLRRRQPMRRRGALHSRRRDGPGDDRGRDRAVACRDHGRLRAHPVNSPRRAGHLRQLSVVDRAALRLADLRHARAGTRLARRRTARAASRSPLALLGSVHLGENPRRAGDAGKHDVDARGGAVRRAFHPAFGGLARGRPRDGLREVHHGRGFLRCAACLDARPSA